MLHLGGRVLHFGKYDGCEISHVLEVDPAYLLWAAANVKGHGIPQRALEEARLVLDEMHEEQNLLGWEED